MEQKQGKILKLWSCIDCPYFCLGDDNNVCYCRNVTTYPQRIPTVKGQILIPDWCALEEIKS